MLIERAGAAVARAALALLGGTYGRRVVGRRRQGQQRQRRPGRRRASSGATACVSTVLDADDAPRRDCPPRRPGDRRRVRHRVPRVVRTRPTPATTAPVLAVDIPSGVDGLTGAAAGRALAATRTVTFAALKPGLLLGRRSELAGAVEVADIGLDFAGRGRTGRGRPTWPLGPGAPRRRAQVAGGGVGGRRRARA